MDTPERIRDLLRSCAWLDDPALAVGLVPSVVEIAGALQPGGSAAARWALPAACGPEIAAAAAQTLMMVGPRLLTGGSMPAITEGDDSALLADPLVRTLLELLCRAAPFGRARVDVPGLVLARVCSQVMACRSRELPGLSVSTVRDLDEMAGRISSRPPAERGALLSRLSFEISARAGAAFSLAGRSGLRVAGGGVTRQLLSEPLLLCFPRGTLDQGRGLDELAELAGLPLPEGTADELVRACDVALKAHRERVDKQPLAIDLALISMLGTVTDPLTALLHPVRGPLLIGGLPELAPQKAYKKAGVGGAMLKGIRGRLGCRALASVWSDLLKRLLVWDLLSVVCARVRDVPGKVLRDRFLQPRLAAPSRGFVAAVGLTPLRTHLATRSDWQTGVVTEAWAGICSDDAVALSAGVADHGVAVLDSARAAALFAFAALKAMGGPRQLPLVPTREFAAIPPQVRPSVGLAVGPVTGGTDGERDLPAGPAVGEAIALSGSGPLDLDAGDSLDVRRAQVGASGLRSEGVVCSAAFFEALLKEVRDSSAGLRVAGQGGAGVGDFCADFECYPVRAYWGVPSEIVVAIALAEGAAPAVELRVMDVESLTDFHLADAELARRSRPAPSAAPEPAPLEAVAIADEQVDSVFGFTTERPAPPAGGEPFSFPQQPFPSVPPATDDAFAAAPADDDGFGGGFSDTMVPVRGSSEPVEGQVGALALLEEDSEPVTPVSSAVRRGAWDDDDEWETDDWPKQEPWTPPPMPVDDSLGGNTIVEGTMLSALPGDLERRFRGYVVEEHAGVFTFGRPERQTLVDAHRFDTSGDIDAAYRGYLRAQIAADWQADSERCASMSNGGRLWDMDLQALERARRELAR